MNDALTNSVSPSPGEAPHLVLATTRPPFWMSWAESITIFLLGFLLLLSVYGRGEGVPGNDSFYHIRMATLLTEHGLLQNFPWLKFVYFTGEGNAFVNHHYGFQALLVPFVTMADQWGADELTGAKWAMATFHGLSLMLMNLILRSLGVRWRWAILVIFVFLPFQFFVRQAYIRAIGISLVFMLWITLTLVRQRPRWLVLIIAAYVHVYLGGVIYAPLLVGIFVMTSLMGSQDDRSHALKAMLWGALGWAIGLMTHPYAGGIFEFLQLQVFGSGLSPDIPVGREWKPYEGVWWFGQMAGVLLVVWATCLVVRLRTGPNLDVRSLSLVVIQFVFLGLTLKARRFIEYWPPFCLLSAAALIAPIPVLIEQSLKDRTKWLTAGRWRWLTGSAMVMTVLMAMGYVAWSPVWQTIRHTARCKFDLSAVADTMRALQEESKPGDVVFTDDWDIFPIYFYYNTHNHYIVGLDPKFTHQRQPELWQRYVKISRGQVPSEITAKAGLMAKGDNPSATSSQRTVKVTLDDIVSLFGARFVVTDGDHKKLARKLNKRNDLAKLIYPSTSYEESKDAPYLIFRMKTNVEVTGE